MNVYLMFRDRDFAPDQAPPPLHGDLAQDLGVEHVLRVMARDDPFLLAVARTALFSSLTAVDDIVYRQRVLDDCLRHPAAVEEMYRIAVAAIEGERRIWRTTFRFAGATLSSSLEALRLFVGLLKALRGVADREAHAFRSDGFGRFFAMLRQELDDAYFAELEGHLDRLRFRHGVLVSARLGKGLRGVDYVLRRPRPSAPGWRQWVPLLAALAGRSDATLVIADRDEAGARALSELRDRGIDLAANAVAQSADHILGFFVMLRAELGFYLGCLNLWRALTGQGEPVCFPEALPADRLALSCRGLYDVGLRFRATGPIVGNTVRGDGKTLVMITGANQGGKSTFLRSLGLAQLMMQAGMFVGAEAFRASVCHRLVSHFRREEDPGMESGKLDEELSRMSAITDHLAPHTLLLFNESFAATNEREGAEIAGGIVEALLEAGLRIVFVTHSFELARRFHRSGQDAVLFLRAERRPDGTRTFRMVEGEPLPTSYGEDLYRRIFGERRDDPRARPADAPLPEPAR